MRKRDKWRKVEGNKGKDEREIERKKKRERRKERNGDNEKNRERKSEKEDILFLAVPLCTSQKPVSHRVHGVHGIRGKPWIAFAKGFSRVFEGRRNTYADETKHVFVPAGEK